MRIAVIAHALHAGSEAEDEYAMGIQAELWRRAGHEVRFLLGHKEKWAADVAIVHVDLTVVPASYIRFARRYPVVLNDRIADIRKTRIASHLVDASSTYLGPVMLKADLNSCGLPEEKFYRRSRAYRWRRRLSLRRGSDEPIEFVKDYSVHDSYAAIPPERLRQRGVVVQEFMPEREGDWYFVRRCFKLGDRSISYRMADSQPIVDAPASADAFHWIDDQPEVLEAANERGLDYGVIDYVVHQGRVVILDVNKTPGRARPPDEQSVADYERIMSTINAGLIDLVEKHHARHAGTL